MKLNTNILIASGFLLVAGTVTAQKAKVVSAYNYNKSYERDKDCSELKKGVEAIDAAVQDEKTNSWAKTWYYGGNLYFNAALTQDAECGAQFTDALDKTYSYYITSMKYNIQDEGAKKLDLDQESDMLRLIGYISNQNTQFEDPSYFRDIIGNKFPYLANAFVNKGVESFQAEEYKKAKDYSEKSIEVNMFLGRVDSLGMYNAALAAERLGEKDEALAYYTALTKIKYGGPNIYFYIANIYANEGDSIKKIETIRKGLEAYPEDPNLILEELSYLLETNQTDKALAKFDKAIANDPKNPALYYNKGYIYEQLGETEKAAEYFNKALDVDPNYFDAAYNLGAMYYNMGAEWNNKASSYGLNETTKYKEANTKASESFNKALPALEKAHELNSEDQSTIASLIKIYSIVGNNEKYKEMKGKLDKLQGK